MTSPSLGKDLELPIDSSVLLTSPSGLFNYYWQDGSNNSSFFVTDNNQSAG